jgi:glycine/D-amino acid oxidase-like deaminating enzyme
MQPNASCNLWEASLRKAVKGIALQGTSNVDLAIIGGGYTGCSAALHAAKQGMRVCLLEAETIGYGGSGRNVGLANAGLWLPPETITVRLGAVVAERLNSLLVNGPEVVFSLIEEHGIDCELSRGGTLHCAHSTRGLADLEERQRQLATIGAPMEFLNASETATRIGSDAFLGALFNPGAGTIQPMAYCHGLARAAQNAGAHLHPHSPALSVSRQGSGWLVETARGRVSAGALLLATNAYHVQALGLAAPSIVPMYFFQMATEPLPPDIGASILPRREGCWDTALVMSSFRRDAAGRLIIGGIGSLDHPGEPVHRNWAERKMVKLFPQLMGQRLQYAWTGRIAMSSDHIPKIQRLGDNGLSVFGYSGRGIAPGTIFGRITADALVSGDYTSLPLQAQDNYEIKLPAIRQAFYETGASASHLLPA